MKEQPQQPEQMQPEQMQPEQAIQPDDITVTNQLVRIQTDLQRLVSDMFQQRGKSIVSAFSNTRKWDVIEERAPQLNVLDLISKLFSRTPYTATIECATTSNNPLSLYISCPDDFGAHHPPLLDKERVRNITMSLRAVIDDIYNVEKQAELLCHMYCTYNSKFDEFLKNYEREITDEITKKKAENNNIIEIKELTSKRDKIKTLQSNKRNRQDSNALVEDFQQLFSGEKFFEFFKREELECVKEHGQSSLQKLCDRNVEIVHEPYGKRGIHVELQGLAYARSQHPLETEFNLGIASSISDISSCCGCCTIELNVLQELRGIIIHTGRLSHDNFPPGLYCPSPNVTEDPIIFSRFLKALQEAMIDKDNRENTQLEPLLSQIKALSTSPTTGERDKDQQIKTIQENLQQILPTESIPQNIIGNTNDIVNHLAAVASNIKKMMAARKEAILRLQNTIKQVDQLATEYSGQVETTAILEKLTEAAQGLRIKLTDQKKMALELLGQLETLQQKKEDQAHLLIEAEERVVNLQKEHQKLEDQLSVEQQAQRKLNQESGDNSRKIAQITEKQQEAAHHLERVNNQFLESYQEQQRLDQEVSAKRGVESAVSQQIQQLDMAITQLYKEQLSNSESLTKITTQFIGLQQDQQALERELSAKRAEIHQFLQARIKEGPDTTKQQGTHQNLQEVEQQFQVLLVSQQKLEQALFNKQEGIGRALQEMTMINEKKLELNQYLQEKEQQSREMHRRLVKLSQDIAKLDIERSNITAISQEHEQNVSQIRDTMSTLDTHQMLLEKEEKAIREQISQSAERLSEQSSQISAMQERMNNDQQLILDLKTAIQSLQQQEEQLKLQKTQYNEQVVAYQAEIGRLEEKVLNIRQEGLQHNQELTTSASAVQDGQLTDKHFKRYEKLVMLLVHDQEFDFKNSLLVCNATRQEEIHSMIIVAESQVNDNMEKIRNPAPTKSYWEKRVQSGRAKNEAIVFMPESDHGEDHNKNISDLIKRINNSQLSNTTVICLERKQKGQNLGMSDVILLSNILEFNKKNQRHQIALPSGIENTPIYQDAVLYNVAKERGIAVVGIEGKGIEGKYSVQPDSEASKIYNANREGY
ncbi:hypothetical protein EDM53_03775, partial [Rickettsiales endosymbiont of Peranema trichophorum]